MLQEVPIFKSIGEFIAGVVEVERGSMHGRCVFCGADTSQGFEIRYPKTFTSYPFLQAGSLACPGCNHLFKTPEYRRKSWLLTLQGVTFLSRSEALKHILNPPEPPFTLYVTIKGKKHGWIPLNRIGVNYSTRSYFVGFEENPVFISRIKATQIYSIVSSLRKNGASKAELLKGSPKPKTMAKTGPKPWSRIKEYAGDPCYELIVKLIS